MGSVSHAEVFFLFWTSRGNLCPEAQKFAHLRVILLDFPDTKLLNSGASMEGLLV